MDEVTLIKAYGMKPWDGRLEPFELEIPRLLCVGCGMVRIPVAKASGTCNGCEAERNAKAEETQ